MCRAKAEGYSRSDQGLDFGLSVGTIGLSGNGCRRYLAGDEDIRQTYRYIGSTHGSKVHGILKQTSDKDLYVQERETSPCSDMSFFVVTESCVAVLIYHYPKYSQASSPG